MGESHSFYLWTLAQTLEIRIGRADHQLLRVETIKCPPAHLIVIVDSTLCVESLNFTEYILYAYIYGYTISSDRCTYTYMYLAY